MTDTDDTEMFDNADEDKDLASQVSKANSATSKDGDAEDSTKKPEEESKTGADKPKEESRPATATSESTEPQKAEGTDK